MMNVAAAQFDDAKHEQLVHEHCRAIPMIQRAMRMSTAARYRQRRIRRRDGQALVEFGLILPLLGALLFGLMDCSFLLFCVISSHFAAENAVIEEAAAGQDLNADQCAILGHTVGTIPCHITHAGQFVPGIKQSAFGSTSLAKITEIDVIKLNYVGGQYIEDRNGCSYSHYLLPCKNVYDASGSCKQPVPPHPCPIWIGPSPPAHPHVTPRNVDVDIGSGHPDYLRVTIHYTFDWHTGFTGLPPLPLTSTADVRLEPQTY